MEKLPDKTTWYRDISLPTFPRLSMNIETEVVILGGGLTGMLSAYLLAKKGRRVVLLEKGALGDGATGHTTGFLTQSIDTDFADLIWMFGHAKAKLIIDSHGEAIRLIEKIIQDEKIDCEFTWCEDVIYQPVGKDSDSDSLSREFKAARLLGLDASMLPANNLPFPNGGSLHLKQQAKFHPLKFLAGIAIAAQKAGAMIYEHTEALNLERDNKEVSISTGPHAIKASWALSATYEPFREPIGLFFKKALYLDSVMELEIPKNHLPEGTYEDTDNPYHYFRVDPMNSHDRVIVGGESHRLDIPISKDTDFSSLEIYIKKEFPSLPYEVKARWQGATLEPIDGLAYIGPYKNKRVWYAFGFSGNGMTYAPIAATMFYNAVLDKVNPWQKVYRVNRLPGLRSLWVKLLDYTGELLHGALKKIFR